MPKGRGRHRLPDGEIFFFFWWDLVILVSSHYPWLYGIQYSIIPVAVPLRRGQWL
jgi:hypothetical protein